MSTNPEIRHPPSVRFVEFVAVFVKLPFMKNLQVEPLRQRAMCCQVFATRVLDAVVSKTAPFINTRNFVPSSRIITPGPSGVSLVSKMPRCVVVVVSEDFIQNSIVKSPENLKAALLVADLIQ